MEINQRKEATTTQYEELSSLSEMLSSFCSEGQNELSPLHEIFGAKSTSRAVFSEPKDVTDKHEEDKDKKDHGNKNNRTVKRLRTVDMDHRVLMERKRRQIIRDKVEILQKMTPNCAKSDLATKLQSIVEYMKSLKHQLDVMSAMAYTEPAGDMQPYYGAQEPMMSPWGHYAPEYPVMPDQNMPYMPQFHQAQNTAPPNQTQPQYKP